MLSSWHSSMAGNQAGPCWWLAGLGAEMVLLGSVHPWHSRALDGLKAGIELNLVLTVGKLKQSREVTPAANGYVCRVGWGWTKAARSPAALLSS